MAPNVTNYTEIQNDEVQVLRSVFMEDFQENEATPGPWNVGRPFKSTSLLTLKGYTAFQTSVRGLAQGNSRLAGCFLFVV